MPRPRHMQLRRKPVYEVRCRKILWLRPTPSQRAEFPAEETTSEQRRECRTPHDRRNHQAVAHVQMARPDDQNPNRSTTYQRELQIDGNRILRSVAHGTCCTLHEA